MVPSGARAAALIAVVTLALPTAATQASSGDTSVTQAYLQAYLGQARAEVKDLAAGLAAMEALRGQLQRECPGVLAREPTPSAGQKPSESAIEISDEVQDALFGVAQRTESLVHRQFAHSVERLRWSDRSLARLVHVYAIGEVEQAEIPTPDLCADMRAWVASDFQGVSATTAAYLGRESMLSSRTASAQEAIMHKLKRYQSPADKRIARRIAEAEKQALATVLPKVLAIIAKVGEALQGPTAAPAS
ncbi:MAG TPA: hypothetical protein VIH71_16345 [Solirubrobacteraceae bacterium]